MPAAVVDSQSFITFYNSGLPWCVYFKSFLYECKTDSECNSVLDQLQAW